jgi:hypothetical protein
VNVSQGLRTYFSFPNHPLPFPSLLSPFVSHPNRSTKRLLGLEEKDSAVAQVEVDKVLSLVGNKGSEVAAYNAVPGWAFALVELGGY